MIGSLDHHIAISPEDQIAAPHHHRITVSVDHYVSESRPHLVMQRSGDGITQALNRPIASSLRDSITLHPDHWIA
ncbi:hypothetical protein A5625_10445 [Mycobacterium sp. 1465703.0]|nr:hypothetical protein A5625_10445 [Mycobacterium sp. 1465703.0]